MTARRDDGSGAANAHHLDRPLASVEGDHEFQSRLCSECGCLPCAKRRSGHILMDAHACIIFANQVFLAIASTTRKARASTSCSLWPPMPIVVRLAMDNFVPDGDPHVLGVLGPVDVDDAVSSVLDS